MNEKDGRRDRERKRGRKGYVWEAISYEIEYVRGIERERIIEKRDRVYSERGRKRGHIGWEREGKIIWQTRRNRGREQIDVKREKDKEELRGRNLKEKDR